MLILVYAFGVIALAVFVFSCARAREGSHSAARLVKGEATVLLVLGTAAAALAAVLAVAGGQVDGSANWWSAGRGQQLIVAIAGWVVFSALMKSTRRRGYLAAAGLAVIAGCLFGLWGLLIEGAWSDRGPLA